MPTTAPTDGGAHEHQATLSGAKITAIAADTAEAFLARIVVPAPEAIEVALGALQDDGTLIGVAVLGAVTAGRSSATVAVAPERRRMKIGSDLLHLLVAEATRRGVRRLRVSYRADAPAADALIRSSGLVAARRVVTGTVTAVLLCP